MKNIKKLINNHFNVKVRLPLLHRINNKDTDIQELIEFLKPFRNYKNFKGINLLPYHKMGINKYKQLGMDYPIKTDLSISSKELNKTVNLIKEYDIPVSIIFH